MRVGLHRRAGASGGSLLFVVRAVGLVRMQNQIDRLARYGADGAEFSESARQQLAEFTCLRFDRLPVCISKTQDLTDRSAQVGWLLLLLWSANQH